MMIKGLGGRRAWLRGVGVLAVSLGVCGCAQVSIPIQADPDVNRDIYQVPSPIWVSVMALRSPGPFEAADFDTLSAWPQARLGKDLVAERRGFVTPGGRLVLSLPGDAVGDPIGVVAGYQTLEGVTWRRILECPLQRRQDAPCELKIRLTAKGIV
jgi:type VI secretion system protein VasD